MASEFTTEIARFLVRELGGVRREIEAYPDDESIWSLPAGAPNSAGTLILHVCGNLQHNVGALLGGTGYERDREAEFATRGLSREALIGGVDATERAISSVLPIVDPVRLSHPFPETMRGQTLSTSDALVHVAIHLAYHLGQIDYHRRLVTGDPIGIDAVSPAALKQSRGGSI